MKRYFLMAVLLLPVAGLADDRRRPPDYGYSRDARYDRRPSVNRIQRDLDSIWRHSRVDRHEANHFRDALNDLRDFEDRAARGHFDRGRLNSAIHNIDHLADARQLHPRDRAILRDHLYALRQMQSGPQNSGWRDDGYRR